MIKYELALLIAIFAFTYSYLLTEEKQIFNGLYNWLESILTDANGKTHWLFNVLIGCEKCVAGQIALWIYFSQNIFGYILDPFQTILNHLFFVAFTIFFTALIKNIYIKTNT